MRAYRLIATLASGGFFVNENDICRHLSVNVLRSGNRLNGSLPKHKAEESTALRFARILAGVIVHLPEAGAPMRVEIVGTLSGCLVPANGWIGSAIPHLQTNS